MSELFLEILQRFSKIMINNCSIIITKINSSIIILVFFNAATKFTKLI